MVLQRDKNIEIFGYTDEKEISASINEINVSAEVKGNRWNAVFPPMQAGGPYTLTIKGSLQTIVYNNVMIGRGLACRRTIQYGIRAAKRASRQRNP